MKVVRPGRLPHAFWRQWSASAVSNLGDGIAFVATPLLAFSLTDDERLLSLTTFVTLVPWLLLALHVGVLVDRFDRRGLMMTANLVRIVLFGALAVAATTGTITIWLLLVALIAAGTGEVVFDSSAQALLPTIVPVADLPRANGYLFAAEVVFGSILGLSVGALLFQIDPGLPFSVNVTLFALAALLIAGIHLRTRPRPSAYQVGFRSSIAIGLQWLRGHRLLRTLAVLLGVLNFGLMLGAGMFVKYASVELGISGARYGLLLVAPAAGAALAGLVGHRVQKHLGTAGAIVVPAAVIGGSHLVFGLFPITWLIAVTAFVAGAAITTWNVVTVSLRQGIVPGELFGRVNSVYRWLGTGVSAVGALVGGQIAYHANLRTPYLVAGALTLGALVVVTPSVISGVRKLSSDTQAAPVTPAPPSIT